MRARSGDETDRDHDGRRSRSQAASYAIAEVGSARGICVAFTLPCNRRGEHRAGGTSVRGFTPIEAEPNDIDEG